MIGKIYEISMIQKEANLLKALDSNYLYSGFITELKKCAQISIIQKDVHLMKDFKSKQKKCCIFRCCPC